MFATFKDLMLFTMDGSEIDWNSETSINWSMFSMSVDMNDSLIFFWDSDDYPTVKYPIEGTFSKKFWNMSSPYCPSSVFLVVTQL